MSYGVVQGTGVVAAAGGAIIAGGSTANGAVSFANSNGVTFGVSGNTVTATVNPGPAAGIGGIIAGTQTLTSQSLNFVNSNGITFGLSNSTNLTASFNSTGFAGTSTSFSGTNVSGSMTLNSAGLNLALNAAGAVGTGTTFSGTNVSGSMTMNSAGLNLALSAASGGGGSGLVGTGTTFAGTNVSGSMTMNSAGLNLALSAAAGGTGGTSGTLTAYAVGNTTQNTSGSYPASSVVFSGAGMVSAGMSGNTVVISGPNTVAFTSFSGGMSNLGNAAGTSGMVTGQLVLVGGSNITLSGSTSAGSATVSIVGGAGGGGGGTASMTFVGNTTNQTSGSVAVSSMIFAGLGGISVGFSNGSIQISDTGSSSLVVLSGLVMSTSNSTISIWPGAVSRTFFPVGELTPLTSPGNGTLSIQYLPLPNVISFTRMDVPVSISAGSSATNATAALNFTLLAGISTKNTYATAILYSMASTSVTVLSSWASNNSGNFNITQPAIRPFSVPLAAILTPGEYYIGFNILSATSSVGTATTSFAPSMSVMGGNQIQTAANWVDGTGGTANSVNIYGGMGIYSASTSGLPASMSFNVISQTGSALSAANYALALRNY